MIDRETALRRASDELGLQEWYRDCVRPILRLERSGWPRCCGGGCEPCNQLLCLVAERVLELEAEGSAELSAPTRA